MDNTPAPPQRTGEHAIESQTAVAQEKPGRSSLFHAHR